MTKTPYHLRIKSKIAELRDQIAAMTAELEELLIAERVLFRLGQGDGEAQIPAPAVRRDTAHDRLTNSDHIENALIARGPTERDTLLRALNEGPLPNISLTTLSSTLTRMKIAGRVVNEGKLWRAVQREEAPSGPSPNSASKADITESRTLYDVLS